MDYRNHSVDMAGSPISTFSVSATFDLIKELNFVISYMQ